MPDSGYSLSLFFFLFLALALGWLLASFPPQLWLKKFKYRAWRESYFKGLQFLLNEQTDHTIESLVSEWQVNRTNFELHNALANMLRRKGEVDRAIVIHNNLLSHAKRAKLNSSQIRTATTELARDYIKAGLLDRAERLLINVVNSSKESEQTALALLLQVYQLEKEWRKAILIAEQLYPHDRIAINDKTLVAGRRQVEIAQFYCEIASAALKDDAFLQAESALNQALLAHPECARATLLLAQLNFERQNNAAALQHLSLLPSQDASLLVEALPMLDDYLAPDSEQKIALLQQWQSQYSSVALDKSLFLALSSRDAEQAYAFLDAGVRKRPTLRGLNYYFDAYRQFNWSEKEGIKDVSRQNIQLIHRIVKDVLKDKADYQCRQCGFAGKQLHWQCPQCHGWDTIRRQRGVDGD